MLVTGGSRGIGRTIAERLGRDGARVALTYATNRSEAEKAVHMFHEKEFHGRSLTVNIARPREDRPPRFQS